MQHYDYENTTLLDIMSAFPHVPDDQRQSILDYIEDKLASGLELAAYSQTDGGRMVFFFKVVAK